MRDLIKKTVILIIIGAVRPCHIPAAELRFVPSLSISEDATDNIYETPTSKHVELVTRVQPGGTLQYSTASSKLEAAYAFDYR